MKTVATFLLVLAFALAAVQGRQLKQSAEAAVAGNGQLSTFQAALKASGLTIPDGSTVFAPDNAAMAKDDLKKRTGLTAADLLKPENKQKLVQLLQHHIVAPSCVSHNQVIKQKEIGPLSLRVTAPRSTGRCGGYRASELTDGLQLTTLLGSPLRVDKEDDLEIDVPGTAEDGKADDPEDATVKQADIVAGNTIIHVVDEVLVPASGALRKSG